MIQKTPPAGKRRFRMIVAYDGSRYSGWQIQPHHATVQSEIERAVHKVTGESVRVDSSGRTDAGVHARGQVVHFDLAGKPDLRKLMISLNAVLPEDIRVLAIRKAASDFHSRISATGKEYRYFIWNDRVMLPFLRHYRAHERRPLDVKAMNEAAAQLVGRNDFAAFSANPHREINGTVRHLRALKVTKRGAEVTIVARGDGFLYKMVRSLAGFLIRVGTGDLEPRSAKTILASLTRTARVPTAPPQGLFLWKVWY